MTELQVEVTQSEDIVGIQPLAPRLVNVLRLPGTDMNLGFIRITEVPHHEDITLVAVSAAVPTLVDSDAIDVLDGRMLYDDHIVEVYFYIAVAFEGLAQIV